MWSLVWETTKLPAPLEKFQRTPDTTAMFVYAVSTVRESEEGGIEREVFRTKSPTQGGNTKKM